MYSSIIKRYKQIVPENINIKVEVKTKRVIK